MRMLLVEDNDELAETILDRLRSEGHSVDREANGDEANDLLRFSSFDIVLLDINLPGRSGYEVLRSMRSRGDATPVIVLTARSEIDDRVVGLDAGADDYMVKPFDFRELSARCRVLARRRAGASSNVFSAGSFRFDRAAKQAHVEGRQLDLRAREVQLLEIMLDNLGRMLTKEEVADKLYTFNETPSLNAVEQLVTRLRRKLEGAPLVIKTARGLGYMAYVSDDD
ncbi:response regulator transcription factor [Salipiger marinus]|jgi:two-component system, OmpR family, response regulator TctD|uniref:Two-component system, OmpR family, response regulator TctD n=2 Tax=Salipiger marinus TaxID=555512 RepID=A0A1G8KCQ5_9RHOB|nr:MULTISPECIES: response regulator transcription factor [Salipiger]SDI41194.1 two-component system, OmpR family, response regulator TctD [Salipiger marinus]HBM60029.1 DNA-binding response regulator [Citreicella sp.]HBT02448.1 DNA-binding response regulator [Citreicella sp.]